MKKLSTVILIFTFNRPYHLENLIKSLLKNKESKEIPLIFFLDGARNVKEAAFVGDVSMTKFTSFAVNLVSRSVDQSAIG